MKDERTEQAENCPVCGGEMREGRCSSCGWEPPEGTGSSPTKRLVLSSLLLLFSLLAAGGVWYMIQRGDRSIEEGVLVKSGVGGGPVIVPTERYEEYKAGLDELLALRKRRRDLLKEKERVFGDLSEERRVEKLLQKTNNRIVILTETLKLMEKRAPGD